MRDRLIDRNPARKAVALAAADASSCKSNGQSARGTPLPYWPRTRFIQNAISLIGQSNYTRDVTPNFGRSPLPFNCLTPREPPSSSHACGAAPLCRSSHVGISSASLFASLPFLYFGGRISPATRST
ncbi:hypothetical protein NL676_035687 [Syzygium grande]|nr:hypothetical protein NL676_035687 [Syzygium grande]